MSREITWRNIDAPDFTGAARMMESGSDSMRAGVEGLRGAFQGYQEGMTKKHSNEYLMGALQAQSPEELAAYMQGEGASILKNVGHYVDPAALMQAQELANTLGNRQLTNLQYGAAKQDFDTLGALNEVAYNTQFGIPNDPEMIRQAMMNSNAVSAVVGTAGDVLGRNQKDDHFNKTNALGWANHGVSAANSRNTADYQNRMLALKEREADNSNMGTLMQQLNALAPEGGYLGKPLGGPRETTEAPVNALQRALGIGVPPTEGEAQNMSVPTSGEYKQHYDTPPTYIHPDGSAAMFDRLGMPKVTIGKNGKVEEVSESFAAEIREIALLSTTDNKTASAALKNLLDGIDPRFTPAVTTYVKDIVKGMKETFESTGYTNPSAPFMGTVQDISKDSSKYLEAGKKAGIPEERLNGVLSLLKRAQANGYISPEATLSMADFDNALNKNQLDRNIFSATADLFTGGAPGRYAGNTNFFSDARISTLEHGMLMRLIESGVINEPR